MKASNGSFSKTSWTSQVSVRQFFSRAGQHKPDLRPQFGSTSPLTSCGTKTSRQESPMMKKEEETLAPNSSSEANFVESKDSEALPHNCEKLVLTARSFNKLRIRGKRRNLTIQERAIGYERPYCLRKLLLCVKYGGIEKVKPIVSRFSAKFMPPK